MGRQRTLEERLAGAALFQLSFELRGEADSPAFHALFPGVLVDLKVTRSDVAAYLHTHRESLEARLRQTVKA